MSAPARGQQSKGQAQAQMPDVHEMERYLDEIMSNTSQAKTNQVIKGHLDKRVEKLEALLPKPMKGEASRLIERAMLTMAKNPSLEGVTPASFIRCVLEAAELGLAIDGRLAYAVPYNNKYKDANGREYYLSEAQFQPSYIGMIAIAKRIGVITDAYGDAVYSNDEFEAYRKDGDSHLFHRRALGNRGECIGAYCVIKHPGGWRYELMSLDDINRIKARSKSAKGTFSPWKSDEDAMRLKTVLKRGLKFYQDDPTLSRMLDLDDRSYLSEEEVPAMPSTGANRLAASFGIRQPNPRQQESEFEEAPRGRQVAQEDSAQEEKPKPAKQQEQPKGERDEILGKVLKRFAECHLSQTEEKEILGQVGATNTADLTVEQCDRILMNLEGY